MTKSVDAARKQAVSWACATIARWAPHLELRSVAAHWDIWWRGDAESPAMLHDEAQGLDWRGLCDFAHACLADRRRTQKA